MELDYTAIKALSSPTRIKILHQILEKESTPTRLSDDLGKSKSTIASHLSVLEDAGLVEKDKEEGRRRVTYAPTRKAQAIIEGRERTVRFSVASSVLSTVLGVGLIGSRFLPAGQSIAQAGGDSGQASALTMQTEQAPARGADAMADASGALDTLLTLENGLLALGVGCLLLAILLAFYGYLLHTPDQESWSEDGQEQEYDYNFADQ